MNVGLQFDLPEKLYLKNPQSTVFGRKLLFHAIPLLSEIGFEAFTFKKLATRMQSVEASVYRYFENKHFLLLYLNCWYWEWVNYVIIFNTKNIDDPKRLLQLSVKSLIHASEESDLTTYINEHLLLRIVVSEGTKSLRVQSVDKENKEGLFESFKTITNLFEERIRLVAPDYPYPKSLASTTIDMVSNQLFYAEHLPQMTDLRNTDQKLIELERIVTFFVFQSLGIDIGNHEG